MYICIIKTSNMKNPNEYATVKQISKKTWAVIDSANQCRFCTDTERKAKNYLAKILKYAGY